MTFSNELIKEQSQELNYEDTFAALNAVDNDPVSLESLKNDSTIPYAELLDQVMKKLVNPVTIKPSHPTSAINNLIGKGKLESAYSYTYKKQGWPFNTECYSPTLRSS